MLGELSYILGREASMTTVERALAGIWRLGFCHPPVVDFGLRFSSSGDDDAYLTQSEGK